ncbi:MAG: cytochrome P450, partial [Chloroflexaceae bacterium]|nr:cytochrome P450 [Chloroflexaceae bacterium]
MTLALQRPHGPDGGFYGLMNLYNFQRDTLGFLSRAAQDYGDISYFRMAAFHFYLLNSPAYVQEVVVKQAHKIEKWQRQTDTWSKAVGHSSLTLEGERWQRNRRILNPSFRASVVRRYYEVIIRHTERLLNRWQSGQSYEMMFEMMRTTMGIIADVIFSVQDMERDAADLNQALTTVFEVLTARTVAFQQLPNWLPTRDNLRLRAASRTIEAFIMGMIQRRRASPTAIEGDILADLINARDEETGAQLSDREICNELKTFFGAGHETTALMLMWTMHLLSQHPETQEKLYTEVDTVLGGRTPTATDIEHMPYTTQVLNESMRIYP